MTDLQVFDFSGRKVRTAGTHDAPLFDADDSCAILGYSRARDALRMLDQDEVEMVRTECADSKKRLVPFVTESGLFSLILGSKRPDAKAFRRWVTGEVLPAIRRKGYYSALEADQERQTERLLAQCFPHLPSKSAPLFRDLITALVRLRKQGEGANPPWARSLASLVYGWAIRVDGQQSARRERNPNPDGSHVDHSMFSAEATEHVKRVVHTGTDFARISVNWEDWKFKMELAFGSKVIQLPMMVSLRALPGGR